MGDNNLLEPNVKRKNNNPSPRRRLFAKITLGLPDIGEYSEEDLAPFVIQSNEVLFSPGMGFLPTNEVLMIQPEVIVGAEEIEYDYY